MVPGPEKVNEEVWSCDCSGKRKMREHCRLLYEAGMSKLKIDETFGETTPLY